MSHGALRDLFARHREGATGMWVLGSDPQRQVSLEAGAIVYATSTHPQDRLAHLLVARGRIAQAQMDYALANLRGGASLGKNLIEMGFITQRELVEVVRDQVERVVEACMIESQDLPRFQAGPLDAKSLRLPLDTPGLLLRGTLALRDLTALAGLLGPGSQVPTPRLRPFPSMACPPDLAPLLERVGQGDTLEELAEASDLEPLRARAFLLFLREAGWVDFQAAPGVSTTAPQDTEPEARLTADSEAPDPALPIHQDLTSLTQEPPPLSSLDGQAPPRRSWVLPLAGLLLVGGGWGAWKATHRTPSPKPGAAPFPGWDHPPMAPPASPRPAEAPKAEDATGAPVTRAQRLATLLRGDLTSAVTQGMAHRRTLPGRWVLRLEIACQPTTLQRAAEQLQGQDADVFVLPRTMGDGRACYQLFLGDFASEAEAREAVGRLPATFLADGNRPRPLPADRAEDFQ